MSFSLCLLLEDFFALAVVQHDYSIYEQILLCLTLVNSNLSTPQDYSVPSAFLILSSVVICISLSLCVLILWLISFKSCLLIH